MVNGDPGSPKNMGWVQGAWILFYDFYFPKEKLLMTILFLSMKGVSLNAFHN
jgi:hypothetical protein